MKINLGITEKVPVYSDSKPHPAKDAKVEEKTYYPTAHIRLDKKAKFPEGEFNFSGTGKIIEKCERTNREGKDSCTYELEIRELNAGGIKSGDEEPSATDSLKSAIKKAASEKASSKEKY